jgi:Ca2+-binding EF-hand superfamily protein
VSMHGDLMAGVVRRMDFARAPGQVAISAEEVKEELTAKIFDQFRDAVRLNRSLYGRVIHSAKVLFEIMDKDSDGVVSFQEFSGAQRRLGIGLSDHQVMEVLSVVGKETEQHMSYGEFLERLTTSMAKKSARPGSGE